MGDGHHVSQVIVVVAQDIRMHLRRRRGAESAAAFAFANLGVDPILREKLRSELTKGWIESLKRFENHVLSLFVGKRSDFLADRRILIVESESWESKQFGFESKVVVRQGVI